MLRGPQSARFGASALAGAIYLRSAAPTQATSARAELSAGNDGLFAVGAALGGRLGDGVTARLSAFHHGSDGFRDNEFLRRAT
ncbi:MAG: TonB-dependent receptor, partial [Gammaproteobacteria bacterium]